MRLRTIDCLVKDAYRIVLRQWETWLLAEGIQLGLAFVMLAGLAVGFGVPMVLAVIPAIKGVAAHGLGALFLPLAYLLVVLVGYLLMLNVVSVWSHVAVTCALQHGPDRKGPVVATLLIGLERTLRAFCLTLLLGLILAGALLFFIVPFFFVAPGLILAWYICILEDRPMHASIALGWQWSRGHRLGIAGRCALLILALMAIFPIVGVFALIPFFGGLIIMPIQLALQLIVPVIMLAVGYLIYADLKPGQEIVDVEEAPMGVLYFFGAWGIIFWILVLGALVWSLHKVPEIGIWA